MTIGILALQGSFALHAKMLATMSIETILVKNPKQLQKCDGLIIPGGESTTLLKLLKNIGLFSAIGEFAKSRPIFGTCAGLIVLAKTPGMKTLGLIELVTERNYYGRQIDSFIDPIEIVGIENFGSNRFFEGVFIRAPHITKIGSSVKPIGFHGDSIVLAQSDRILVATFHPELTIDTRIHEHFISMANDQKIIRD